ncbi:hypothetical protein GCM10025860_18840 [Methanobacterium ferruginis]|nr:hypothetical protein GCM10025860_18840 [Methanobacterium ferruginis]
MRCIEKVNMNLDNKGIASAELLFVTLIALVIIAAMLNLVGNEMNQEQIGNLAESRITGETIAEAINTVYINGDGYSITIHMDPDPSFTAIVLSDGNFSNLTIFSSGKNVTIDLIPPSFNDTYNLTSGKSYIITNTDGNIGIKEMVG